MRPILANLLTDDNCPIQERDACVVKLTTASWGDDRGVYIKKSLRFLRNRCKGFNILEEEVGAVGGNEIAGRIINIDSCMDGVYQVIACNESRDWESGVIDSFDLKLVPYE